MVADASLTVIYIFTNNPSRRVLTLFAWLFRTGEYRRANNWGEFQYQSITWSKRSTVGMFARCYMRRRIRPVDPSATRQPSVSHLTQSCYTKVTSWWPDNRSSFHNSVSRRPGYNFSDEIAISISLYNINQSSVGRRLSFGSPVFRKRAWPNHPPHSSSLLSKPRPKSPRSTYFYLNLCHHALIRYTGHHLRCHRWHCLR